MNTKLTESECNSIETSALRLQFPRIGDRYGLNVLVVAEPLFSTIDGSDQDAWPASPPLQQLHFQDLPSGPAALAVGAAGTTHWSVSLSVREPGLIWCEYAARVGRGWEPQREWLGTRFEIAAGWQTEASGGQLSLVRGGQRLQLRSLGDGSRFETDRPGEIAIVPRSTGFAGKGTVEWKFELRLMQPVVQAAESLSEEA